jgi:RHS repeat-associated protein
VANQLTYALAAAGRTTYAFDAAGNQQVELTPVGARTTTTWNYENQPTVYHLSTGSRVTMSYNADNRRTQKQTAATTSTKFIWEPTTDAYFSQLNNANTNTKLYTFEPVQYGNLISQRVGGDHYVHADALGSTRALSSTGTTVSDTFLYDAWGTEVARTGATAIVPFRWIGGPGYYLDTETQLFYVRARFYQPSVARWCGRDILWPYDRRNPFVYCSTTPLMRIDPSGAFCIKGPLATTLSWINPFDPASIDVLDIVDKYIEVTGNTVSAGLYARLVVAINELAVSANPPPALAYTNAGWNAFLATKEFRTYAEFRVDICCPGTTIASAKIEDYNFSPGWTPIRLVSIYSAGVGSVVILGPTTGGTCTKVTVLSKVRVGPIGQAIAIILTGIRPPWVTAKISYTICCDNTFKIEFGGSPFPSHRGYIDRGSVGSRIQSELIETIFAGGNTVITPVSFATGVGFGIRRICD